MNEDLITLKKELEKSLSIAQTALEIEKIAVDFLGRKGKLTLLFQKLGSLSTDEKREYGATLNQLKSTIEKQIDAKRETLTSSTSTAFIDTTLPGEKRKIGHLHPTTRLIRKINEYFHYYGYSVYTGPEIETNEFNFEKLNLPPDHPARDLADTLYIVEPEYLLRTHTSSVETRAMTTETLPLRIVAPGKVYRNETSNVTNNSMFYQYEGLVVDKNITMGNLKATLIDLVRFLYGKEVRTRFRCKYYPQVEPGAGLDVECSFCHGKGCQVCKYRGFIEVLGAGMVHPHVLTSCGIDPKKWSGFAFGMGLDRLTMLEYGISDIRTLYNGELVLL